MKLNKFVVIFGIVVVAGLAFIMTSQMPPEKEADVSADKQVNVGFAYLTSPGDRGWT